MKTRLIVALGVLATVGFAQESSGPFGLRRGMTRAQVIEVVGKGAIKEIKGDRMGVLTVPKPHPAFGFYWLGFSPDQGLLKILALGNDIETNGFGEEIRESFKTILDAVSKTYGKPGDVFDYVRHGSTWEEPEDWMMGLVKKERRLDAFWTKGPFPNRIHSMRLEAKASSVEKGFIELSYEFDGFNSYLETKNKKAGSVF